MYTAYMFTLLMGFIATLKANNRSTSSVFILIHFDQSYFFTFCTLIKFSW